MHCHISVYLVLGGQDPADGRAEGGAIIQP